MEELPRALRIDGRLRVAKVPRATCVPAVALYGNLRRRDAGEVRQSAITAVISTRGKIGLADPLLLARSPFQ